MKDNRFIELLNLYIDRQISAEETAELEAEIQHNPKRQAIYRRYCQIHTASKLVYQSFRTGVEDQPATHSNPPATVELFENRRRRNAWATLSYYTAGLAAAACVAFVVVRNVNSPVTPAAESIAASDVSAPVVTAAIPAAPVPEAVPVATVIIPERTPNLISLRNATATPDYSAMLAALREQDEERALAGERWQRAQVSLFEDNVFDPARAVTIPAHRPPQQHRSSSAQQAEFTAFQFQR